MWHAKFIISKKLPKYFYWEGVLLTAHFKTFPTGTCNADLVSLSSHSSQFQLQKGEMPGERGARDYSRQSLLAKLNWQEGRALMQWNTSVRAGPSTMQRSFPANKHACCMLAGGAARADVIVWIGFAVVGGRCIWGTPALKDECGGDPRRGADRPALTGYCFTQLVCAAPIPNERNFTVAVSGAGQRWEKEQWLRVLSELNK